MDSKCDIVQEQIGGSVDGEFSSDIYEHLKSCKGCDKYLQDIVRLEKIFKTDALDIVQPHEQIWQKSKWSIIAIAAIMIIFVPNPFQKKSSFHLAGNSGNSVMISSETQPNILAEVESIYSDLAQVDANLARENNIWEQLDDVDWQFDAYSQSMEAIQEWELDDLELLKT